ncbi:hypothetical protein MJO28_001890 [Puccinia striiformis f. sp. tritici]|uniref:Uncharacterized protein n=1 Tax=Puccinia striiformis f. sp. tritici TaxID=168172 RepID=A0ACC0EWB3_9BASI|nr:hypothetical protein MJO28_001890 [Puccinia striiformis f. sp. tritici]
MMLHYSYLISSACLLFFVKSIRTRVPGSSGFTNDLKIRNRLLLLPRKISDSNSHPKVLQDIHSLAGCPGEVCGTLAGDAVQPLLAGAGECAQQDMADKIIDAAKTQVQDKAVQQKLIELAKIYRQTERNTFPDFSSPSTPDRNSLFCQKSPKNPELAGLFQKQSSAADPNLFFDPKANARTQPLAGAKAQPAPADSITTNKEEGDDVKEDDVDEPAGAAETTSDDSEDTGNPTSLVSNPRSAAQLPNIRTPAQLPNIRTAAQLQRDRQLGKIQNAKNLGQLPKPPTGLEAVSDASNQNTPASEGSASLAEIQHDKDLGIFQTAPPKKLANNIKKSQSAPILRPARI